MNQLEVQAFLEDRNLWRLIEKCKATEDIFDLIKLGENQNSDLLSWLLSPNEGHGQGDAILKDLLIHASSAARRQDVRNSTKRYFENWTLGRIATTGFGSAFVMREHQVGRGAETKKGRVDLLVVDPVNEFIVVVENKRGHTVTPGQLEKYEEYVKGVAAKSLFRNYDIAYIVLDQKFDDDYSIDNGRWVYINYTFLKHSAERAQSPAYRMLDGSRVLLSYVRKQVDRWSDAPDREISRLASELAWSHKSVVGLMTRQRSLKIHDWDGRQLQGERWEIALFQSQYRGACERICDALALGAIQHQIEDRTGALQECIYATKKYVVATSRRIEEFEADPEKLWPVCVCVEEKGDVFDVALEWRPNTFSSSLTEEAKSAMYIALSEIFDGFKGRDRNANPRRKGIKAEVAVALAAQVIKAIDHSLPGAPA